MATAYTLSKESELYYYLKQHSLLHILMNAKRGNTSFDAVRLKLILEDHPSLSDRFPDELKKIKNHIRRYVNPNLRNIPEDITITSKDIVEHFEEDSERATVYQILRKLPILVKTSYTNIPQVQKIYIYNVKELLYQLLIYKDITRSELKRTIASKLIKFLRSCVRETV